MGRLLPYPVSPLARLQRAVAENRNPIPFGRLVGFHPVEIEAGRAVIEVETGDDHLNPNGRAHGGLIATIADSAMGLAHISTLNEGEQSATVELKVNYLRAAGPSRLRATGTVVKNGRTLAYVECDVLDGEGRLIARASGTFIRLTPSSSGV